MSGLRPELLYDKFVIHDSVSDMCYGEHCGFININQITDEFVIKYSKFQMKKVECLKEEYNNRVVAYKKVCDKFDLDHTKYMTSQHLVWRELAYMHLNIFSNSKHVTTQEYKYIEGSFTFGILYCKPGIYHTLFDYDINSAYSYCMQLDNFKFPITQGIVYHAYDINDEYIGIWKLKIMGSHPFWKNSHGNY